MNTDKEFLIHAFTRADALESGDLVDVSTAAREAGITYPTAVTRAVWEDCIAWTDADSARTGCPQDESGRLWDVVWMTRYAITRQRTDGDRVTVELYRVRKDGTGHKAVHVQLVAVVGPGDQAEPVITIMQPSED